MKQFSFDFDSAIFAEFLLSIDNSRGSFASASFVIKKIVEMKVWQVWQV
jgi:hypothetical protein